MEHLEDSGTSGIYTERTVLKVKMADQCYYAINLRGSEQLRSIDCGMVMSRGTTFWPLCA
jgi:hypothetical protein